MVALAWQSEQNAKCPGCGQPWHESTDSSMFESYEAEAIVCFACAERESEAKKFNDNEGGPPAGLYVLVHKHPDLIGDLVGE